jgi:hypothetical protein
MPIGRGPFVNGMIEVPFLTDEISPVDTSKITEHHFLSK